MERDKNSASHIPPGYILPFVDYLLSSFSFWLSFHLHHLFRGSIRIFDTFYALGFWRWVIPLLPLGLMYLGGAYAGRYRSPYRIIYRILFSHFLSFFIFTTLVFYLRFFQFPRLVILLWIFLSFIFISFSHVFFIKRQDRLKAFALFQGDRGKEIFEKIKRLDLEKIVGGIDISSVDKEALSSYLEEAIYQLGIEKIILILFPENKDEFYKIMEVVERTNLEVDWEAVSQLFEEEEGQVKLIFADIYDYQSLLKSNVYIPLKRGIDFILSLVIFIILLPLFAILALLIYIDSPGPVLYWQERMGKEGRIFQLVKFRTMIPYAEKDTGPVLAKENDPRITRIGRFLRRTRIDELPQLWNVIRGEMSLIGPRPERPEFVRKWKDSIPHYELRLLVRPGITGWAQVMGRYDEGIETVKAKLQYDLYYIKHLSFSLDFEIALRTIYVMLLGKGAR